MDKYVIRSASLPTVRVVVIPEWLRLLPPFNKLVYVKRTYQNSWTSNTRVIVLMRKRSSGTVFSAREGRDIVHAGSAWQKTCLCLKTFFCHRFWVDLVQEAEAVFKTK